MYEKLNAARYTLNANITMLPILFENEDIVAVDKPAGLASVPERQKAAPNVLAELSAAYPHKVYVVHRLDKYASGVILFAKNPRTHRFLNRQFTSRTVKKAYLALVHGRIEQDKGVIDKPLRQFGSGRVAVDTEHGKQSLTEFEVADRFELHTLVRAYPATGRLHQLRVHFYSIGHPIVGDLLYGRGRGTTDDGRGPTYDIRHTTYDPRLMLHAEKIAFELPSGEELTIASPLPDSFAQILQFIRDQR